MRDRYGAPPRKAIGWFQTLLLCLVSQIRAYFTPRVGAQVPATREAIESWLYTRHNTFGLSDSYDIRKRGAQVKNKSIAMDAVVNPLPA